MRDSQLGMTNTFDSIDALAARIQTAPMTGRRKLVALAGPPASGKSTLADKLVTALGRTSQVVPMDGFHLDNALLIKAGLLDRKGAPHTFDAAGFVHLVNRLQIEDEVIYPTFDRDRDIAVAGTGRVTKDCNTVIVEGNYLLFDMQPWRALARLWDISIRLDPPIDVLRNRLVARWRTHGLSAQDAHARAEGNDLANARAMVASALPADITLS